MTIRMKEEFRGYAPLDDTKAEAEALLASENQVGRLQDAESVIRHGFLKAQEYLEKYPNEDELHEDELPDRGASKLLEMMGEMIFHGDTCFPNISFQQDEFGWRIRGLKPFEDNTYYETALGAFKVLKEEYGNQF